MTKYIAVSYTHLDVYKRQVEKDVDKPAPMAQPVATTIQNQSLTYPPIYQTYYTGEKTAGEMGAAKSYLLAYNYLRVRSWQAYTESEVVQIIINKYIKWVIGNGLKLQPCLLYTSRCV